MADQVVVSVGTKRGLFLLRSDTKRRKWTIDGPLLKGWPIHHAMIDTRGTPRLFAAASSDVYGNTIFSGGIDGRKLKNAEQPPAPPKLTGKGLAMARKWGLSTAERVWVVHPGPERQRRVLYAGTAPAGLFKSDDGGKRWEPVDSLNRHRTRKDWTPGAGGQCLHSIQIDPTDPDRMYVAISAAGSFRTTDGGRSWEPINKAVARYVGAPEDGQVFT